MSSMQSTGALSAKNAVKELPTEEKSPTHPKEEPLSESPEEKQYTIGEFQLPQGKVRTMSTPNKPSYYPSDRTSSLSFKPPSMGKKMKKPEAIPPPVSPGTLSTALNYISSPVRYITSVFSSTIKPIAADVPDGIKSAKNIKDKSDGPKAKSLQDLPEPNKPILAQVVVKERAKPTVKTSSPIRSKSPTFRKSDKRVLPQASPTPEQIMTSDLKISQSPTNKVSYRVTSKMAEEQAMKSMKKDPRKMHRQKTPPHIAQIQSSKKEQPLPKMPEDVPTPTVLQKIPHSYRITSKRILDSQDDNMEDISIGMNKDPDNPVFDLRNPEWMSYDKSSEGTNLDDSMNNCDEDMEAMDLGNRNMSSNPSPLYKGITSMTSAPEDMTALVPTLLRDTPSIRQKPTFVDRFGSIPSRALGISAPQKPYGKGSGSKTSQLYNSKAIQSAGSSNNQDKKIKPTFIRPTFVETVMDFRDPQLQSQLGLAGKLDKVGNQFNNEFSAEGASVRTIILGTPENTRPRQATSFSPSNMHSSSTPYKEISWTNSSSQSKRHSDIGMHSNKTKASKRWSQKSAKPFKSSGPAPLAKPLPTIIKEGPRSNSIEDKPIEIPIEKLEEKPKENPKEDTKINDVPVTSSQPVEQKIPEPVITNVISQHQHRRTQSESIVMDPKALQEKAYKEAITHVKEKFGEGFAAAAIAAEDTITTIFEGKDGKPPAIKVAQRKANDAIESASFTVKDSYQSTAKYATDILEITKEKANEVMQSVSSGTQNVYESASDVAISAFESAALVANSAIASGKKVIEDLCSAVDFKINDKINDKINEFNQSFDKGKIWINDQLDKSKSTEKKSKPARTNLRNESKSPKLLEIDLNQPYSLNAPRKASPPLAPEPQPQPPPPPVQKHKASSTIGSINNKNRQRSASPMVNEHKRRQNSPKKSQYRVSDGISRHANSATARGEIP